MLDMFSLEEKTAIVTGGNRGLGNGMAHALCEAGAEIVIFASSDSVFDAAKALQEEGYKASGMKVDLSNRAEVEKVFASAVEALGGRLDILVNNAGTQRRNPVEDFTFEDWDTVLQVNLSSVFQMCQLAGRIMLKQGKGKIINVASMLSFFGGFTVAAYAASKGGVAQLTKALTNEWAGKGININAIAPGYMDTEMNTKLIEDKGRNAEISARIPMHRWGTSDDMKGVTIFLASEASNYLSGAIIPVDGGYLVK